jgi:hypothetical protein
MPRDSKLKTRTTQLFTGVLIAAVLAYCSASTYAAGVCGTTPNFTLGNTFTVGDHPSSTVVGDFNGDLNPDIAMAIAGSSYISVMMGTGAGSFSAPTNVTVGNSPIAVQVGDFNGDGKTDLVVSRIAGSTPQDPHIHILLGNGGGGFTVANSFYVGNLVDSIAVADFNGDGKADLALENQYGGGILYLRFGNGAGAFTDAGSFPLDGRTPDRVIARDLNGDGRPDVVVTDMFANYVIVLLNNGAGGFSGPTRFIAAVNPNSFLAGPKGVVAADFNSDGKVDLAVANPNSYVSILLGNGSGGFGTPNSFTTARDLAHIVTGDFNDDGKFDIAAATKTSKEVLVILGDGAGGFGAVASFGVGESPTSIAVADFNHDGKSDLVASRDGAPGSIAVLLNSCDVAPAPLPGLSVNDITLVEPEQGPVTGSFTVTLSAPSTQRVSVSYSTAEGTATLGDFGRVSGTIYFEPGETTKTIFVGADGDPFDEFDETFTLNLSNPIGATIVRGQGTCTILDSDPPPTVSISDTPPITEGNSGPTTGLISVSLSKESGKPITVSYTMADGTAIAGSDYPAASGSITFIPGQPTSQYISFVINGDTTKEENETFFVNLSNPVNVTIADGQGIATIWNDDTPTVQMNQLNFNIAEGAGSLSLTVRRFGDPSIPVAVNYATFDGAGLQDCDLKNGKASSRCDYVNVVGTLRFNAGDTSKTISIPIVDDTYLEGTESFSISLSSPSGGAVLGGLPGANIRITDNSNDGTGQPNPIDETNFFVRQHYIDFLGREPDPASIGWNNQINNCVPLQPSCDRLSVSQGIYSSPEFKDRGYFIYKFYSVAFGRKPTYDEFVLDRARVSGFQTEAELEQSKLDFIADFMSRAEFSAYSGLTDDQYVLRFFNLTGISQVTVGTTVLSLEQMQQSMRMGKTRAQVLREVAESPEVSARYLVESTIVMHYFGYLRRDPDAAYQDWIGIYNQTGDSRNVTNGFVNSQEYRNRFGQ